MVVVVVVVVVVGAVERAKVEPRNSTIYDVINPKGKPPYNPPGQPVCERGWAWR